MAILTNLPDLTSRKNNVEEWNNNLTSENTDVQIPVKVSTSYLRNEVLSLTGLSNQHWFLF